MAPVSPVAAKKKANDAEKKEEPPGFLLSKTRSSSDSSRVLRLSGEGSFTAGSGAVRTGREASRGDQQTNTLQCGGEDSRAGRLESSGRGSSHTLPSGVCLRRENSGGSRSRRSKIVCSGRSRSSTATVHWRRRRRRTSSSSDAMRGVGSSSGNRDHGAHVTGVTRQVSISCREAPEHQRSGRSGSNSSCGRNPSAAVNTSAGTAADVANHPRGRWPVGSSSSSVTLQHAGSAGSWPSGRQSVSLQGGTSSSSLQKHLGVLQEGSLSRSPSRLEKFGSHTFRHVSREGWESTSPQRFSAALLQHRSTSSASLATPRRQVSTVLYTRHQSSDAAAAAEVLRRVPESAAADSPGTCPQSAGGSGRHIYSRAITRLRASTPGAPASLPRGGFARGGTMGGGGHQQRGKTARDVNLAAQRRRRSRKQRDTASPAVSSRLRRMLRMRSLSTSDSSAASIHYHRVYLVLGLLHHKNGGDFVQNGFVCLRACDVTHETNALMAETATFIWDRDRGYPDSSPMLAASRMAAAAAGTAAGGSAVTHASLGAADSWIGGGVLLNRDLQTSTGATGRTEQPTVSSAAAPTGGRCRASGATSSGFGCLSLNETHTAQTSKYGSACAFSPMTVFTIGVRVAVKPSTPSEERKTTMYLRDYLASQLATYPFLRHYVLITKYKKRRSFWPFSRPWRQPSAFSIIGTGQYSAVVNASTQVDGLTPLEVCLVHRPKRRSFALSKGTMGAFSFMTSVAGTVRSSFWKEPRRSR